MGTFTVNSNTVKRNCKYCEHETSASCITRHEKHCYLNPDNIVLCPVCGKPVKNYKTNKTCSYACSNTFFRSGEDNPNWKSGEHYPKSLREVSEHEYKRICFHYHKKECIICGEDLIVEVHHYDGNNKNNHPTNYVPLCPTHHRYWHSRHRSLIKEKVRIYVENFRSGWKDLNFR